MKKYKTLTIVLTVMFIALGCDDLFDYSAYESKVKDGYKNQTINNINQLKKTNSSVDSFSFVTIADNHLAYYELEKQVEKINGLKNIDFVVHLGDMTQHGRLKEYEIFSDYIKKLQLPVLTVIGNHDYLSNGEDIYQDMFGAFNYSISYKGYKLIFFDAIVWESNKTPDMKWLEEELTQGEEPKLLFSHIHPSDEQFNRTQHYKDIIENSKLKLAMFGHWHAFQTGKLLNTNIDYIIPGWTGDRMMSKITVYDNGQFLMTQIPF